MLAALLRREGRRAAAQDQSLGGHRSEAVVDSRAIERPRPVVAAWNGRWRVWLIAAAASVLLALILSVSEATGVTELVPTIIRVVTGEGSLVIEVDDPTVSVALDGQDITIIGAGIHELKLRPGTHRFVATKNGHPAHTELVTIQKGQRRVVTVTLELSQPAGDRSPVLARDASPLIGHTGPVWCVAFTPDGKQLVSTSQDGTARVWDVATHREMARFERHGALCVYSAVVSPDGEHVLSGGGDVPATAQLAANRWSLCWWDRASGRELKRIEGSADSITSITLSADGMQALVGYYSGKVVLWDVPAWREIRSLATTPRLWSVAFSPDGQQLVTGSGASLDEQGSLRLWKLSSGEELTRFASQEFGVWRAAFAPDGKQIVSTGGDHAIRFWNAQTGAMDREIRAINVTTGLAFSTDGSFLVTGNYGTGKTVSIWNLLSLEEVQALGGHTQGVQSVAISRDGRWAASGSHDCTIRLWPLPKESERAQQQMK
jgi:WD40 repeat protein